MQALMSQALQGTFNTSDADAEYRLLHAAGMAHLRATGGYIPAKQLVDDSSAVAPHDDAPYLSETALQLFYLITHRQFYPKLLTELTDRIVAGGYRIPEEYLPPILNSIEKPHEFPALFRQRGVWMGRMMRFPGFFEDMGAVIAFSDEDWHSTNIGIRESYFRHLRQTDPDKARELLIASWDDETYSFRDMLVRMLNINLSVADEDVLEQLLPEYTRYTMFYVIFWMLYSLPDSQLHQDVNRRLAQQLRFSTRTGTIYIKDEDRPVIQKAGYTVSLHQAMTFVPAMFWMQLWDLDADALIQSIQYHDEETVFLYGWQQTARRTGDTNFIVRSLYLRGHIMKLPDIRELLSVLSPDVSSNLAAYWLETVEKPLDNHPARVLLQQQPVVIMDDLLAQQFIEQLGINFSQTVRPLLKRDLRETAIELRSRISIHLSELFLQAIRQ
ncbi:MAG: DUF5691 domain-containing protein, partial [Aggregatilineales bacterium]